jgi:hypothetical protein
MQKAKHTRTHLFMHNILQIEREKEIIGAIVQGFTCLTAQTAQNLILEDLEDCPTSA